MAFRIEKTGRAVLAVFAVMVVPTAFGQDFRYEAFHWHSRPPYIKKAGDKGVLTITASGVSFEETYAKKKPKHPHIWKWEYQDIQQLRMAPTSLSVLTYKSNKWKLGADREYYFTLVSADQTFQKAFAVLKNRLDQRFVAAIPEKPADALWTISARRLTPFGGDEGLLRVGPNEIVYESEKKGESRSWRYEDIENVTSSGPFSLIVTTFERAGMHYGNLKAFNFELKQPLDEGRYNDLWLRLNQSKGLSILNSYRETPVASAK